MAKRKFNSLVQFDGCPMPYGLALMLQDARDHGAKFTVTSADRRKGIAEKYGKKSQWWLYMAFWVWHLKGANPANRPGQSTHERRSDGVAYRGPVGRPLASWWKLGLDAVDEGSPNSAIGLVHILNKLGYSAFRPYPSGSEAHHFNLKRSPVTNLKKRHRY